MPDLGRMLIIAGAILLLLGLLLTLSGKVPWIGHLPGDISIERDGFRFYFPLTTCIVVSVLISVLLWMFRR
jgi:hypothetical protein